EYLANGQIYNDSFTYQISDGDGGVDTGLVSIDVTGTNDDPVGAVSDVTGGVTELVTPVGNLTDSGTIGFSDVDLLDVHSVSAVTPSAGALGSLTASLTTDTTGTGLGGVVSWSYSVAASAVEYLAAGEHKNETLSLHAPPRHDRECDA